MSLLPDRSTLLRLLIFSLSLSSRLMLFFLEKWILLLCIQTLSTLLFTPISSQNLWTTQSSCLCIFHPTFSAKLSIFSFCSGVNFVLNLFFWLYGRFGSDLDAVVTPSSSIKSSDSELLCMWLYSIHGKLRIFKPILQHFYSLTQDASLCITVYTHSHHLPWFYLDKLKKIYKLELF